MLLEASKKPQSRPRLKSLEKMLDDCDATWGKQKDVGGRITGRKTPGEEKKKVLVDRRFAD